MENLHELEKKTFKIFEKQARYVGGYYAIDGIISKDTYALYRKWLKEKYPNVFAWLNKVEEITS